MTKQLQFFKRPIRCCLELNGKSVVEEIPGRTGHAKQLSKFSAMKKTTMNFRKLNFPDNNTFYCKSSIYEYNNE